MRRRMGYGLTSGSDVYPQPGHHILSTLTPSPSVAASNMNLVHYSPGSNSRQQCSAASSSFYSVPSPLYNPPVLNIPHKTGHPTHEQHGTQLPPLGQISSYASRMSPMLTSHLPNPTWHRCLTSALALALVGAETFDPSSPPRVDRFPLSLRKLHSLFQLNVPEPIM